MTGRTSAPEQLHAEDVRLLPLDVGGAHIDDALQPEARAGGGGGDAVLPGAGLGDDPLLAHAARQQDLPHHVVDLVRAGVIELVALQVDLRAAQMLGQPLGEIQGARPADIVLQEIFHLGLEGRIVPGLGVGALEFEHERHQRLGDEAAAIDAEMPALVGAGTEAVGLHVHDAFSRNPSSALAALRAAVTKALILLASLTPGRSRRPTIHRRRPGARCGSRQRRSRA